MNLRLGIKLCIVGCWEEGNAWLTCSHVYSIFSKWPDCEKNRKPTIWETVIIRKDGVC